MKRKILGHLGLVAMFGGLVVPLALAARGGAPVQLPNVDLPPGKSLTITFDVTINPQPPGVHQVANQGSVTGDGVGPVLTDDPDTADASDPTITDVIVPTPTATPTSTATPTATPTETPTLVATATPSPLCGRADGCFAWEMLSADASVSGEIRFRWRVTNNCTTPLARADFRFLFEGLVIGTDGEQYTAPSGRVYQLDIIGAPHPGVNFLPVGAALQPGDSGIFRVPCGGLDAARGRGAVEHRNDDRKRDRSDLPPRRAVLRAAGAATRAVATGQRDDAIADRSGRQRVAGGPSVPTKVLQQAGGVSPGPSAMGRARQRFRA